MERPAAVACAAPQAPSAKPRPARVPVGIAIAAVSVATEKRPPPRPMQNAPAKNTTAEFNGPARITAGTVRLDGADVFTWNPGRQFDAICITGAVATDPDRFGAWLKPGGRLFVIHGQAPVQEAVLITRHGDSFHRESLFETDVPYLHGAEPAPQFTL